MTETILNKLAKSREKLLAVVSNLTDDVLDRRAGDGWSIRENLTHIVNAEEDHRRVIEIIARREAHRLPTDIVLDEHNAARLAKRGRLSLTEILAALDEERRKTEALFQSLNADQLTWRGVHPVLGDMAISDIFRILGIHDQLHLREIVAILQTGA